MGYKLLSIGAPRQDIVYYRYPFRSDVQLQDVTVHPTYYTSAGGSALNVACMAQQLGLPSVLLGKTGTDIVGQILAKHVADANVRTALVASSVASTNLAVHYTNYSGKIISTLSGSAASSLNKKDVDTVFDHYISQTKYLFFSDYAAITKLQTHVPILFKKARKLHVLTIIDTGTLSHVSEPPLDFLRSILSLTDLYLTTVADITTLFQVTTLEAAFAKVHAISDCTVIVKHENFGAVGLQRYSRTTVQPYSLPQLHPVGAGDAFDAAFLKAFDLALPFKTSLRLAVAAASLKSSHVSYPSWSEVIHLYTTKYDKLTIQ